MRVVAMAMTLRAVRPYLYWEHVATDGSLSEKAKMMIAFLPKRACRPQTSARNMPKIPTSITMSRAVIIRHAGNFDVLSMMSVACTSERTHLGQDWPKAVVAGYCHGKQTLACATIDASPQEPATTSRV